MYMVYLKYNKITASPVWPICVFAYMVNLIQNKIVSIARPNYIAEIVV